MRLRPLILIFTAAAILVTGSTVMSSETGIKAEKETIEKTIESSIGWAATKDTALLFSVCADDPEFFIYHPDAASTITGIEPFKKMVTTLFMNDSFKATRYEFKNMRINLSRSGNTAWFSCLLDDFYEWDGKPGGWENVRYTGVLEKRDGNWVIVQMHYSFATDARSDESKE